MPHTTVIRSLRRLATLLCLSLVWLLASCRLEPQAEVPGAANAVYYWRSELTLTDAERRFLTQQDVRKVYLHLFDVVRQDGRLMPRATLTVTDTLPRDVKVIPVVFLAPDVMRDTTGLSALPQLITRRVRSFMEQNELPRPDELQLDFDWTRSNQARYFELLSQMRPGFRRLSATIRLHQLSTQAPPVDYGALMIYNVGRLTDPDEPCSILNEDVLEPYLRHLKAYPLPLCTALPVYSWDLLFHQDKFRCILRGVDLRDTAAFSPIDATHFRAIAYQPIPISDVTTSGSGRIFPGDVVRHEFVSPQVLARVREQISRLRPSACRQVILYHLDERQLKQYDHAELQSLYRHR